MQSVSSVVSTLVLVTFAGSALAQTPRMGGPMKHIMVTLTGGTSLEAMADPSVPTPVMQNYGHTYTGNASVLNGTMYNAQYGWMVEGFWAPPSGSLLWIEQFSATPGLLAYSGGTMMNQGTFSPIFGTDGSSPRIQWSGTMLHNWYAANTPGDYTAIYRVYFGDANGVATPGSTAGEVTLNWTAVPAPGAAAVLGLGGLLAARRRRA
ncbi:MAG: hypothetical protein LW822_00530 [Phycisphaeraceae bacterium]|jgi:hypothetical protein|nr:hypothetical protein [Phycisphaeraceae bacterium]